MWYPTKKLWEISIIQAWWTPNRWTIEFWWWKIPWLKISDLNNSYVKNYEETITEEWLKNSSAKLLKKWTILYSIFATIWKMWILDIDATTNQAIAWITADENIVDKMYLFFTLKYYTYILVEQSIWVAQNNINSTKLKSLSIPLPPLPTQKLIVQKLDSSFEKIDKSIELTKKNLENIEELNKSILEENFSWYNNEIIWNLVEKTKNWNPKNIWESFFEYIDISSIDNKNYLLTETKNIRWIEAPSRAKQLVIKNDIIFATTRPNLKNISVIDLDIENLTCSTWFCVLRTIEEKLYYKFLFYYIVTDLFQDKLTPYIRWAQYPAISDKDLKSLKIPLPPLEKQKEIVLHLDQVFEKNRVLKEKYENKLKDLEEMKQSLLKEAFEWRLVKE